jgi:hypothetical protein
MISDDGFGESMKRYIKREDVVNSKRIDCIICDIKSRLGESNLIEKGWLKTQNGYVCPACPE